MSEQELAEREQLIANTEAAMNHGGDYGMDYEDVVQGRAPIDISHAGGEMNAMAAASVAHPK